MKPSLAKSTKTRKLIPASLACLYFILINLLIFHTSVYAADTPDSTASDTAEKSSAPPPMPSPLTLEAVLQIAGETHPDLVLARADIALQNAKLLQVDSAYGLRAFVIGEARYIEPSPIAFDQSQNDSVLRLVAEKRLYDFGRTGNAEEAAKAEIQGSEWWYKDARNQYRLAVVESFFNVLLADLRFIRDNEAMSVAFIAYDRAQDRNELGQRSDIDLLEAQSHYQSVRRQLYSSRSLQRSTRSRLANILNRPGELVAEIAEPALTDHTRKIPEVEELQEQAKMNNPVLNGLRKQKQAADERVASARAGYMPVLDGVVRINDYARLVGSYNRYDITLRLNVPLLSGGVVKANVAKENAALTAVKAKLRAAEMDILQAVLENWQLLDTLRIQREEMEALLDFRDLYLDRSRALYELEVKTDLGDSMVQVSDARLNYMETLFKISLVWARLDALLGKEIYPIGEIQ